MNLNIKWLSGVEDLSDSFFVREEVFVKGQNIPKEEEYDAKDIDCEHIVIYDNNNPIATGRIVYDGKYHLGRIAVLEQYRGKKVATTLLKEMIKHLEDKGVYEIHLSSQLYVLELYKKVGFKDYGDIYLDCDIEHKSMIYKKGE